MGLIALVELQIVREDSEGPPALENNIPASAEFNNSLLGPGADLSPRLWMPSLAQQLSGMVVNSWQRAVAVEQRAVELIAPLSSTITATAQAAVSTVFGSVADYEQPWGAGKKIDPMHCF